MPYLPGQIIVAFHGGPLDGKLRGNELSEITQFQLQNCMPGDSLLLPEGGDIYDYFVSMRTDFDDVKRLTLRFIGYGRPPGQRQESLEMMKAGLAAYLGVAEAAG